MSIDRATHTPLGMSLRMAGEASIVLGLTLFLPFMVHLLPSWDDSPLGAHLLPIFYAPLGALVLGRFGIAVVTSFLAPWVNYLLTGSPMIPMAVVLCLQLVVFLVAGEILLKRKIPHLLVGPLGYVVALLASALLGTLLSLAGQRFPVELAAVPGILFRAVPGLVILALIGYWFGRHKPLGA